MLVQSLLSGSIKAYLNRHAPPHIIDRGWEYHLRGAVSLKDYFQASGILDFTVKGTLNYRTSLSLTSDGDKERWSHINSATCNCPAAEHGMCKHQVAVLLWLRDHMANLAGGLCGFDIPSPPRPAEKPKIQNPQQKRSTDEPFFLEDYKKARSFEKYYSGWKREPPYHSLRSAGEPAASRIEVETDFSFSPDMYRADTYTIELVPDGRDLWVSCTCGEKVDELCVHAVRTLELIRQAGLITHLPIPSQSALDAEGRKAMGEYGLTPESDWPEYFHSVFDLSGRKLTLRPEHNNILDLSKVKQLFSEHPLEISDRKILGAVNDIADDDAPDRYNIGFAFCFSTLREKRFGMHTLYALPGKKGGAMGKAFKSARSFSGRDRAALTSADRTVAQFVESEFENRVASGRDTPLVARLVASVADELETRPHLYITDEFINYTVRKGALTEVQFRKGFPPMRYTLERSGAMLTLNLIIRHGDEDITPGRKRVEVPYKHFLRVDDTLYFSASPVEANHLELALKLGGSKMPQTRFAEIFTDHLAPLFRKYPLTVKGGEGLEVILQKQKVAARELYLSEMGNFVMFKPCLRYEDDTLVDLLSEGEVWEADEKGIRAKTHNAEEAEAYLKVLRGGHPDFTQQFRSDFFCLHYDALLDEQRFVHLFSHLRDAGVKVFGEKDLSKLKQIPIPAQVAYTVKREIDWFELNAEFTFGDQSITLAQLKKRFVPGSQFVDLGKGRRGSIPMDWYKRLQRIYRLGQTEGEGVKLSGFHFNVVDELFKEVVDPDITDFIADRRAKLLDFTGPTPTALPRGIKASLRPYQTDGFRWLCFLDEFGWGGILADDMGLGKTLQMITFLKHILKKNKQTNLVVVPTSLLFNWENELKKFAPAIKYHVHYGPAREKNPALFDKAHLVITSYGHMLSDVEWLREYAFNYVVLDESQAIKNPASKRYKAARLLKAINRIAMTGTPVENNTFDLFAQLSFTNPGMLGSAAHFKKEYAKAIDSGKDSARAAELQRTVQPFILRRTKEQVAKELPDKTEDIIYCEMDKAQRKIYDAHRNEIRETMLGNMESEIASSERFKVLQALTRLRQVCNSPLLLPGNEKYGGTSVKIDLLLDHIREKTGNHKILVFSQFTQMLGLIQDVLQKEGINHAYLDGKCNNKLRQAAVDTFQTDPDCRVFLISLKAGGTGLNLMAADYVYIVDPWWNPAVENQAIDRCYRIGQDKKVIAYRMICKDTVEEKIMELQSRKKKIASDLISTDEGIVQKLDGEELKALFL